MNKICKTQNPARKVVLVTAIGTMNCTTIIGELKKSPDNFYIIGADINEAYCIANSREVDEFYRFPSVIDDRNSYVDFVKTFCFEHNVDYLYCVVDEEVESLALRRAEFENIGTKLCLANTEVIVLCHNKDKFAEWSEKEIPQFCIKRFPKFDTITRMDFPLFIKPVEGRASIGCKKISTYDELESYQDKWSKYIVEEFVSGDIVAVDIVRSRRTKQIGIAQRLELLRNSNGCGTAVKIVDIPEVKKACEAIAEKLDLEGVINAEFFLTENGPKIIEVNPRLPAGIAYSCMAGLNVVKYAMRIANNEPCVFNPVKIGKHYAKRYETYET